MYLASKQSWLTLTVCNCREYIIIIWCICNCIDITKSKICKLESLNILVIYFDWFFLVINNWWTDVQDFVLFLCEIHPKQNNRFQVTVHLFNNFSQKTPKFGKKICEKTWLWPCGVTRKHGPPLRTGSVDYLRTGPWTTPK